MMQVRFLRLVAKWLSVVSILLFQLYFSEKKYKIQKLYVCIQYLIKTQGTELVNVLSGLSQEKFILCMPSNRIVSVLAIKFMCLISILRVPRLLLSSLGELKFGIWRTKNDFWESYLRRTITHFFSTRPSQKFYMLDKILLVS